MSNPTTTHPDHEEYDSELQMNSSLIVIVVMFFVFSCCSIVGYYVTWGNVVVLPVTRPRQPTAGAATPADTQKRKEAIQASLEDHIWSEDHAAIDDDDCSATEAMTEDEVGDVENPACCTVSRRDSTSSSQRPCCPICLVEFEEKELVSQSKSGSCYHSFHNGCIATWLLKHEDCPICRTKFLDRK